MMLHAIIWQHMSAACMLGQRHHLCCYCRRVIMWKRSRTWVSQREQRWAWRWKVLELCRELIIRTRLCRYLSTSTPVHKSDMPPGLCVLGTTIALKNKSISLPLCYHEESYWESSNMFLNQCFLAKQERQNLFTDNITNITKYYQSKWKVIVYI